MTQVLSVASTWELLRVPTDNFVHICSIMLFCYLLLLLSWKRNPPSVALPEVSSIFPTKEILLI